jgi:ketosteroid isomerase-like protein
MKNLWALFQGIKSWRGVVPYCAASLTIAALLCGPAVAAAKVSYATEAEITAVLTKMAELYKQKDVGGLMALYSRDKDVVAIGTMEDEKLIGYDRIKAGMEKSFAELTEIKSVEVRPFATSYSGKIAWCAADIQMTVVMAGKGVTITGRLTAVLRKTSGKWRFQQTHFSLPTDSADKQTLRVSAPPVLGRIQKKMATILNVMDAELARTASELSKTGVSGPEARKALHDLCKSTAYAVDCATVDGKGKMVIVEPKAYQKFEGSDISAQDQIKRLHRTGKPVFSDVFTSVEGFEAADLEYPVFSQKNEVLGSVSVLMKPEALLSKVIAGETGKAAPLEVWAMQTDGRILYDPDRREIGKLLFRDALYKPYPELLSLGERIAKERNGHGSYRFPGRGSDKPVTKEAFWTTVGLHGAEWRIVASRVVESPGQAR